MPILPLLCLRENPVCKNYSSGDQLMFIDCSGSSRSAFYLYRSTSVGLSHPLSNAHVYAWKEHSFGMATFSALQLFQVNS